MSWPPTYTPPRAWHCCSAACCSALVERVQVPAAYVPPADVQIASPPPEQAARESRAAIAKGTGLTARIRAAARPGRPRVGHGIISRSDLFLASREEDPLVPLLLVVRDAGLLAPKAPVEKLSVAGRTVRDLVGLRIAHRHRPRRRA